MRSAPEPGFATATGNRERVGNISQVSTILPVLEGFRFAKDLTRPLIVNCLGPPSSKGEERREKVRAKAILPSVEGSARFRGLPLRLTLPNGGTKSPSLREDGGLGVLPEKDLRIPPEYIFPHRGIKGGTIMQTKSFGRFTLCRG